MTGSSSPSLRRGPRSAPVALLLAAGVLAGCVTQSGSPPVVDRSTGSDSVGTVGTVGAVGAVGTVGTVGTVGAASESAEIPRAQPLHDGLPPDGHVVQPGDTLYGIAWRYGVDYRAVARINGIAPPYRIQVGQRLVLADPGGAAMSGPAVAGGPVPAGGPDPGTAAPEPSSRGFEFIPETPAGGAAQDTWQDLPPPSASAPGMPPATGPGPQSAPAQPAPAGAPVAGLPAPGMPVPGAPAPAASAPVLPAPAGSAPIPAPTPTAPLDELPPETLGTAPQVATAPMPPPAAPAPAPAPRSGGGVGPWRWPTTGKVEKNFGNGNKGIDFRLDPGAPVVAAGGGEVVYAGNGLGGFRHLVIVKHDQRFLSAYSLNWPIAVKEGQRIDSGGTIATAGGGNAGTLRFEIRRDGQPVDPASIIKR